MLKKIFALMMKEELAQLRKEIKDVEELCVRNAKLLNSMNNEPDFRRPIRRIGRPPKK